MKVGTNAFLRCLVTIADLHLRKNLGYSGSNHDAWSNFRKCEEFGVTTAHGIMTRMSDKWSRAIQVFNNETNNAVNESLIDTLFDLAAYAIILICVIDNDDCIFKSGKTFNTAEAITKYMLNAAEEGN